MTNRFALLVGALTFLTISTDTSFVSALSKKKPSTAEELRARRMKYKKSFTDRAAYPALKATDCSNLPGVWTGYEPSGPLYDAYQLTFRGTDYPPGSFTAVYIEGGPSWSLGIGQLSSDNTTVTMSLDNGGTLNGNVSADCSTINWDNDSSWRKTTNLPKKVYMVSMNHLDVGYNGIPEVGVINNVLNTYFTLYFPRAVAIAQALRARDKNETFVYTTHPWLVDLYLNCPSNFTLSNVTLQCPSLGDQYSFKQAILNGDIAMHAAPFNIEYGGAYNDALLDAIFQQPKRVAAQIGIPAPRVASLRDVPGAPRSLIPALVRNGIPALSIGVNNYAPRPQIPTPCMWTEPESNTSVLLIMTEEGQGYPINVGPSPTDPGGLAASFCVEHNQSAAVLCFAFRTDNSGGPESVAEVLDFYEIAAWQWPGAQVVGSTFDEWYDAFQDAIPYLDHITLEMGETWLTGFAADPPKNAFYRVAAREYKNCLTAGNCDPVNDARIINFLRMLMKMPEHTWGLPSIYDNKNYTNSQFHAARYLPTYVSSESSWNEQRQLGTVYAMEALADHPLRAQIASAATFLQPTVPSTNGFTQLSNPGATFTVSVTGGTVSLALDTSTGGLASLIINGNTVANSLNPMAVLEYQTINDTTVEKQHITTPDGNACCCCYGWDNMQSVANPQETRTFASLVNAWASQSGTTLTAPATFLVQLTFPSILNTYYGAPSTSWVNYTVNTDGTVSIELQLFNKTATRLGEAIFFRFATPAVSNSAWFADVLGYWTDPLDVVVRGSQHQHGVGDSVVYISSTNGAGVAVDTIDAPVMSPWTATDEPVSYIVPYDPLTGPVEGFASIVFSNTYNTNFPLYSVDDAFKLRYTVRTIAPSEDNALRARRAASKRNTEIKPL